MGDEIARAEFAIQKSLEGQTVSLISSGDPGVFGMANVLYQIVSKYEGVEIKVYPGVSALNYASSHLGAPLHDFAAISLSNILTPMSEIEKKLRYALEANMIVAIYNPISKTRKEPFKRFKQAVLDIRGEDALIGIVDSTFEPPKETIVKVKDLTEDIVNMSCTLIVGNDLTYVQVPKYIQQVYQSDFEFMFNFRNIDQYGNPHVPNTGQSIGGMIGLTPMMTDIIIPKYTFDTSFDFQDTISVSGHEWTSNEPPITIILNVVHTTIEDFNEQTIPEELNYDPSLQTS
jgi:precorrin-3B C17-methyltransferase